MVERGRQEDGRNGDLIRDEMDGVYGDGNNDNNNNYNNGGNTNKNIINNT